MHPGGNTATLATLKPAQALPAAGVFDRVGTRNPLKLLLLGLVRGYQIFISPVLPRSCKYHPSCSQYAIDALMQYGVLRGAVLAGWRILRCNPLSYGGYDPAEAQTLFRSRRRGALK